MNLITDITKQTEYDSHKIIRMLLVNFNVIIIQDVDLFLVKFLTKTILINLLLIPIH